MSSGRGTTNESKSLARLFCYILMHWQIGVSSSYIKGEENVLADKISRTLDHTHFQLDSHFHVATQSLKQQIPEIQGLRCFRPSPELLKLLNSALSTGSVIIPTTKIRLGQLSHM